MLNLTRFLVAFVTAAFASGSSYAYVVIDNFDAGAGALGAATTGVDSSRDRATGVVGEDPSGNVSTDNDLSFPTADSGRSGNNANNRRSERTMLRYMGKNDSGKNLGGGGSASGGGGSRGRRPTSRRNSFPGTGPGTGLDTGPASGIDQPIVNFNDPNMQAPPSDGDDTGMNVTHFDGGSAGGSPGIASDPAGDASGDPSTQDPVISGTGPSPSPVSGTPEPTALAVWTIAGCCGYGFLRFSQKRLTLK